ncbi:MAG: class I SAM-dependent methyltransferase [Candidatus Parcubacteria bacterium]|nr:class I SAM-dependent methyltransferase [Candidatus Parcubacteria bacterium]
MRMMCALCGKEGMTQFLSLGHQPPSDAFLKKEDLEKPEITYPLDLFFCSSCTLVQLGYAVDPDILFRDYVYNTSTNNSLKANFKALVDKIISEYQLVAGDFVIDIGSNDGTLLENYLPYQIKVLGIDPSSATSLALEKGVPTLVDYFNVETAAKVCKEHGKAKIITATNVFAHVKALDSFMRGIKGLLDEKGVFISENGYVVDMIEGMQYDAIYHEHLRYYSVTALCALFARYEMEVVSVERIPSHGGSIRVYAAHKGALPVSENVATLCELEKEHGFTSLARYQTFANEVVVTKIALLDIIYTFKKKGARIAGIGAPAKGNTLLNYCKLDGTFIECLTEKSALKIGLYSPGMHIPVIDEAYLFEEQPEAALLLSWNLADELVPKIRQKGYKGVFIIPNPVPKCIE